MTNVYILGQNLKRYGIINNYTALSWSETWGSSGSFSIYAPVTAENTELLVKDNLIWIEGDNVGVIEILNKSIDEDTGLPSIEASGRFIESVWLGKRIIWGTLKKYGYPSDVIREIINTQVISPINPKRKLSNIVSTQTDNFGKKFQFVNSYGNCWDQLEKIDTDYNLDTRLVYDKDAYNLKLIIKDANDKSGLIRITTELGAYFSSAYSLDISDFCNTALVAGEGEGADRKLMVIGADNIGLGRNELYVDARDLQSEDNEGNTMTTEEYEASLLLRGKSKLQEHAIFQEYSANLKLTGTEAFKYGKDYFIGDLITVEDSQLMVKLVAIVRGHDLSRDRDGETESLVLGLALPTITKLLKRRDA